MTIKLSSNQRDGSNSVSRGNPSPIFVASSVNEIGKYRWDDLVHRAQAPIFYEWNFVKSIEDNPLTTGAQPFYLYSEGLSGRLSLLTTLYLQTAVNPFGTSATPEKMLVGHLWHCYDTRVLTEATITAEQVQVLKAEITDLASKHGATTCGLCNIDRSSPLAQAIESAGYPVVNGASRYCLFPEAGATLSLHLEKVGRATRKTLKHYYRRAQNAGAKISFVPTDRALDEDVLNLCLATANKHAPGYYPPSELNALLRSLGDNCRILRVELGGVLLAVSICLLDADAAHFWAGGCLYPDELNWSPQYVLFAAEIEFGFLSGRSRVEFGRRNDEFKKRHGLQAVGLSNWTWSV